MMGAAAKITLCGATTPVLSRAAETPAITATSMNANYIQTINGATAIAVTMIRTVLCEVATFVIPGGAVNSNTELLQLRLKRLRTFHQSRAHMA
jgi:hypothetical protein